MLDWKIPFGPIARVLATLFVWALVLPWVVFALMRQGAEAGRALRRLVTLPRLALASHIACPRNHRSALQGVWECGCGALFAGYAFQGCPICGVPSCGYVTCEHCGLAVKNPFL